MTPAAHRTVPPTASPLLTGLVIWFAAMMLVPAPLGARILLLVLSAPRQGKPERHDTNPLKTAI